MEDAEEGVPVPMDIFLIGDKGVGKSLFIKKFVEDKGEIKETENAVRFGSRVVNVNQLDIRFKIHNCTSPEEFMKIKDEECPNVKSPLIVIVCDAKKPDSFKSLKTNWINFVRENFKKLPEAIVMTKGDENKEKGGVYDEFKSYAIKNKIGIYPLFNPNNINKNTPYLLFTKLGKEFIMNAPKYLKVLLLGGEEVGKKAMIKSLVDDGSERFIDPKFNEERDYFSAIWVFNDKQRNIKDTLKLLIYSFGGKTDPSTEVQNFDLKNADAIALVCDCRNSYSLNDIKGMYEEIKKENKKAFVVLALNKIDLLGCELNDKIDLEKVQQFAHDTGLPYYQCSANQNKGIAKIFHDLAINSLSLRNNNVVAPMNNIINRPMDNIINRPMNNIINIPMNNIINIPKDNEVKTTGNKKIKEAGNKKIKEAGNKKVKVTENNGFKETGKNEVEDKADGNGCDCTHKKFCLIM